MRSFLLASLVATSCSAMATNSFGTAHTTGNSSSSHYLQSVLNNPAMNPLVITEGENWRLSYFPSGGFSTEVGKVDNFAEDLEDLADILDDPSSSDEDVSSLLERFNNVLEAAGDHGYVNFKGKLHAPLTPLYFFSPMLDGTVGVDVSVGVQGGVSILDDELTFNSQNNLFDTATAIYLKSGSETTISISYGRVAYESDFGTLYAGIKAKYINMGLSKQLIPLVQLAGSDLGDLIEDEYDRNQRSSSDFGVDLGFVWEAENYRLGLSAENLNSPEFEYGEIGTNCALIEEGSRARSNCEVARYFGSVTGDINLSEVHVKDPTVRIDGLYHLSDKWFVTGAYDLVEYNDTVGAKQQWVHAALAYTSESSVIPGFRVGYHKNLSGTETSSITAGLTLFQVVNLDLEYGLESVEVDNTNVPRRTGISISVHESF